MFNFSPDCYFCNNKVALKKQSLEVLLKKAVLKNFAVFTEKRPALQSLTALRKK